MCLRGNALLALRVQNQDPTTSNQIRVKSKCADVQKASESKQAPWDVTAETLFSVSRGVFFSSHSLRFYERQYVDDKPAPDQPGEETDTFNVGAVGWCCHFFCFCLLVAGINFIDAQPRDRLGELAFSYIREEGAVKDLAGVVEGSSDR